MALYLPIRFRLLLRNLLLIFLLFIFLSGMRFMDLSERRRLADLEVSDAGASAIVLTGSHDRLREGMRLLRAGRVERLFISGVYPGLGLSELLSVMRESLFFCVEEPCIELGHRARDTRQNACESLSWLRRRGVRRVYLVTSDFHWARSRLEFGAVLAREGYAVDILPHVVRSSGWFSGDILSLLRLWASEYMKWLWAHIRIFVLGASAAQCF